MIHHSTCVEASKVPGLLKAILQDNKDFLSEDTWEEDFLIKEYFFMGMSDTSSDSESDCNCNHAAVEDINKVPRSVAHYQNISVLDLSHGVCARRPVDFALLSQLTSVNLTNNQLTDIPEGLEECHRLESLNMGYNPLEESPSFPESWKRLKSLSLNRCGLTAISATITALTALLFLNLEDNLLTTLPPLWTLVSLEELSLSLNPLRSIPDAVIDLKNLTRLNVSKCELNHLPDWLGKLQNLLVLRASSNVISELPESMGRLKKLAVLMISKNNIRVIPKCVAMLPNLHDIYFDALSTYPPALFYRSQPVNVYARNSVMYELPEPELIMPSTSTPHSLMVYAARRLGLRAKNYYLAGDAPKACLEHILSAQECSTPGCRGVFVKGAGREATEHQMFRTGLVAALSWRTCHPRCSINTPANRA